MKSPVSSLQSLSRFWPPLVAILLCLPAALPYLSGDLPRSNDTLTHLYRAVELEGLLRAGLFIPRWGPHFAHGYGYPIFNYFAYLSHYLIALLGLIGLPLLTAVKLLYILGLSASGLTAYLLAKDLVSGNDLASPLPSGVLPDGRGVRGEGIRGEGNPGPALLAAVAYAYSPYLLFTAHVRGGLPEVLALAFVPLAFWAVRRALILPNQKIKYILIAALAIAGFIFSHIGMALQYLPLLGLWGLYYIVQQWWLTRKTKPSPHPFIPSSLHLVTLFTLALGLMAFIWLPSVLELPYVQFDAAFARAGLVYTANFLQLPNLVEYPSLPVYTQLLNPPLIRSLPLVALIIALLGLLRLRVFSPNTRADYLVLLAFSALCAFLTLDLSKPLWDAIPILQRSAFPWRFLGPASLFLALAAALSTHELTNVFNRQRFTFAGFSRAVPDVSRLKFSLPSLFIVHCFIASLLLVSSVPFLFPPREPALQNPSLADLARYEIPPLLVGTTTTGEYTPIDVKEFPDTHDMQTALLEGREPERLILNNAPDGVQVEHLTQQPLHETYQFTATESFTATYRTFYFPGWTATLDGEPIDIQITDPNGLMAFTIPSGTHTLDITFDTTPAHIAGSIISIIALLVFIAGAIYVLRHPQPVPSPQPLGFWKLEIGFLAVAYCSLFIVSLLIVRSGPPSTQHPLNLDFGGELTLLGYDQFSNSPILQHETSNTQSPISSLQSQITLVWQAQHLIGVPYGMNIRLTDDSGLIWNDTNIQRPANWRFFPGTDGWPVDQYILDPYIINPVRGTPPDTYHLEVIVYRADTLQALSVQRIGDYVVDTPTNELLTDSLLTVDNIALISAETDRAEAAPGDPYRITLHWQALAASPPDQQITLELVDAQGNVQLTRTESVVPSYSPPNWKQGDVLRQDVIFRFPAGLPGGTYHWRIGNTTLTQSLTIHEPQRLFEVPPLTTPRPLTLTDSIHILGYNATIEGNAITIEIAWQPTSEISEPYQVFLHLIDSNGSLVSQSDGEPANWTRPTTGWLPGEIILDPRSLTAPAPGTYTLMVGMVDPSGNRIAEPLSLGPITIP